MSNGDAFIVWDDVATAEPLLPRLTAVLLSGEPSKGADALIQTYRLPADYAALRERTNHYVELVHAHAANIKTTPSQNLNTEAARGPLTAWSVDQIGKLLNEVDLRDYVHIQPIYRRNGNAWDVVREERFISFNDLRRERFPKLDLITPQHLFLALCETLDQRLLLSLYKNTTSLSARAVHLNLSVATVTGAAFAHFVVAMPRAQRSQITFELHRGDLLQDLPMTLSAIELLRREGFQVALDGITPDMVPIVDVMAFGADFIKINVARERTTLFNQPSIRKAFAQLPAERLIFFRCDSDAALAAGKDFGVTLFQGWLIDDVAHHVTQAKA